MILTELAMNRILKEEYDKRIVSILLERCQLETSGGINVWQNADPLKVIHDESGLIFSFHDITDSSVRLLMPYERRVDISKNDESGSNDDNLSNIYSIGRKVSDDLNGRDYFVVDIKTFESDFSPA